MEKQLETMATTESALRNELSALHEELLKAHSEFMTSQEQLKVWVAESNKLEHAIDSHTDKLFRKETDLAANKKVAMAERDTTLSMLERGTYPS